MDFWDQNFEEFNNFRTDFWGGVRHSTNLFHEEYPPKLEQKLFELWLIIIGFEHQFLDLTQNKLKINVDYQSEIHKLLKKHKNEHHACLRKNIKKTYLL